MALSGIARVRSKSRSVAKRSQPDCFKCRYFMVTWDYTYPRACRVYGFRGRALPSQIVLRESGVGLAAGT